jgi:hypothetical protein
MRQAMLAAEAEQAADRRRAKAAEARASSRCRAEATRALRVGLAGRTLGWPARRPADLV